MNNKIKCCGVQTKPLFIYINLFIQDYYFERGFEIVCMAAPQQTNDTWERMQNHTTTYYYYLVLVIVNTILHGTQYPK